MRGNGYLVNIVGRADGNACLHSDLTVRDGGSQHVNQHPLNEVPGHPQPDLQGEISFAVASRYFSLIQLLAIWIGRPSLNFDKIL